jgi:hypothetical protein
MIHEPHWHEQNPWKDTLVYVPLEELAACTIMVGNLHDTWSMIDEIAYWTQYGDKLDAYILVNCVEFTAGVRYGPEGSHYISPGFSLPKLYHLLQKHYHLVLKKKAVSSP